MLRRPAASWSGLSATVIWIVEQFGTATTPSCSCARRPFTSGTTSGTFGSMRQADDLSIATAPPLTAWGTSSRDPVAPMAKKQRSNPPDSSASAVPSLMRLPSSSEPADRALAKYVTSSQSRIRPRSTEPAAPVAPTIATLGKVEGLVKRAHGGLDFVNGDVACDLDRRCRDDGELDALVAQRGEGLGGDPGMALHPCADHADLAEVVARRPPSSDRVEGALGVGAVVGRRREDDLVGRDLHDRVDVDRRIRKCFEQRRGADTGHAVDELLARVHDAGDDRLLEHRVVLLRDPGAFLVRERGADVQPHAVVPRELDRA